jgi:hypothetical protein
MGPKRRGGGVALDTSNNRNTNDHRDACALSWRWISNRSSKRSADTANFCHSSSAKVKAAKGSRIMMVERRVSAVGEALASEKVKKPRSVDPKRTPNGVFFTAEPTAKLERTLVNGTLAKGVP